MKSRLHAAGGVFLWSLACFLLVAPASAFAADEQPHGSEAVFLAQITILVLLGRILGEVIREQWGDEFFELEEEVRTTTRELRERPDLAGLQQLLSRLERASLGQIECLVRSFTAYFHIANTAEQHHRISPEFASQKHGAEALLRRPADHGISNDELRAFLDRLRKTWKGKLFIKGMDTREDARLCIEHGVDGMLVSNHGGRSTDTLRATIEALPEVVAEVGGKIPVFVDGGFRRGTDVFKALALGAKAVGVGRPFLWGLGAFGQPGVDRVIEILQGELKLVMGNCGTRTVADINREYVATPDWKI